LSSFLLALIANNEYGWLLFCVILWTLASVLGSHKEYEREEDERREDYERKWRKYSQAQNALLQVRLGIAVPPPKSYVPPEPRSESYAPPWLRS
jgi:hypothetical protein